MQSNRVLIPIIAVSICAILCRGQEVSVTLDKANGVYAAGDTARWQIDWKGGTNEPAGRYRLLKGQLVEISQGELSFSNGVAELTTKFAEPETMFLEVKWKSDGGKDRRTLGGAIASPEKIGLSAPRPADFDGFWKTKVKELETVPMDPKLESVEVGNTNLQYWKIAMDNIRGTHIYGQLARPAKGDKFPALLIVQWAGVYPLQKNWVTDRAGEGWLVLDIEAHDLPIDQPEVFYKEQFNGPLKDYWAMGNDDRDRSCFLRMYLSCYRAVEYLAAREDWDGKTLVVMGGSQGGQQALMTAGLHPEKITAALAIVPAGCDMLGPEAGRAPGWPHWYSNNEGGKDPKKVRETSRYFDVANFAPNIRCPVLVGYGLIDEVCPAAGIAATLNQIKGPKEWVVLPRAAHQDEHDTHGAYTKKCYGEWLPALRIGNGAPLQK